MTPAIMSSQTLNAITDELQQTYNTTLLEIFYNLKDHQKEELQFYYKGLIPSGIEGTFLNILFGSLENAGKISWTDVGSLKEGLCAIRRMDLAKILTSFETKRDLTLFLDAYARKRRGSESQCYQSASSIEVFAKHLVRVTTAIFTDEFNNSKVKSLRESSKNIGEVLFDFDEQIENKQSDPWSKLAFLVIFAGEVVAEVFMMPAIDKERQTELDVLKFCFNFCYNRLMKLGGNWEDFRGHVEERFQSVFSQHDSDAGNSFTEEIIADMIQQLTAVLQ